MCAARSQVNQGCGAECNAAKRVGEDPPEEAVTPSGEYCCKEEEKEGGDGRRRLEEAHACASAEDTGITALSFDFKSLKSVDVDFTKDEGEGEDKKSEKGKCEDVEVKWHKEDRVFKRPLDANETAIEPHCENLKIDFNLDDGVLAHYDADTDELTITVMVGEHEKEEKEIKLYHCISEEHEHEENALMATMILVILVVLVMVSIFFEWASEAFEDYLEENMPESVPVLKTIMKELTILGFLGLCAFLLNKSGVLPDIGEQFFGHSEEERNELPEVFENIHMTLFFVMALFLAMGGVLVYSLEVHEKRLRLYGKLSQEHPSQLISEYLIKCLGYTERGLPDADAPGADDFEIVSSRGRYSCRRLFGCHKNITTKHELKEAMLFFAMRVRFIRTFGRQGGALGSEELQMEDDFDFAEYLANAQAETAEELIELTLGTWAMLGVFFLGVYGVMLLEDTEVQCVLFIAFGYGTTFTSLCLSWWMTSMQDSLTIPITGEKGRIFLLRQYSEARATEGEENTLTSPATSVSQAGSIQGGVTVPLMGDALARSQSDVAIIEPAYSTEELSAEMKQFMRDISDPNSCCSGKSFRKHGLPNKHRLLFGKFLSRFGQGPHFVLFLVRYVMLLTAIYLAMLVTFLSPIMIAKFGSYAWIWIVVAALPVPYGMFVRPSHMIALWCTVCKIEQLADEENVKEVLETMRDRRVVAAIKMIGALADARRIEQAGAEGEARAVLNVPVHTTKLEKTLEQERKRNNHMMFDTFDSSGDGQLDQDEFKRLMEAIGTSLDASQVESMIQEIELMTDGGDDAGDGEISFEEFHNYMEARAAAEETSEDRMKFLFSLFDQDGDGDISMDEFIDKMKATCTTLTDQELQAVCRDCDKDHDGSITMGEFGEWIEKFSTD